MLGWSRSWSWSRSGEDRSRHDLGSTSLTTVLLTPMFVVLAFMAFQAAMWTHARTEARVVARDAAAQVARAGASAAVVEDAVEAALEADDLFRNVDATIVVDAGGIVTVSIVADAPGIIRGTSDPFGVTEALPLERRP